MVFDRVALARADCGEQADDARRVHRGPSTGRLFAVSTAYVKKSNVSWQGHILGLTAGLSATRAHAHAKGASDWGPTARADESAHPVSGFRQDEDDILWVPGKVFCHYGAGESFFVGEQIDALHRMRPRPWVLATGGDSGFTAEFPFWGYSPAIFMGSQKGTETALLQVTTDERNPTYGSGVLLRLTLPSRARRRGVRRHGSPPQSPREHGVDGLRSSSAPGARIRTFIP